MRRFATKGLRNAFVWWKKQDEKEKLQDYCYYVGPVRADFWEASREIDNLKLFMQEERFTETQIENTVKKVNGENRYLLKKYITRMQHKIDKTKPYLPAYIDRWRRFVALRKLYRFKFRMMCNKMDNVKADLQTAFNFWKNKPLYLRQQLETMHTPILEEISLMTTKKVGECAE